MTWMNGDGLFVKFGNEEGAVARGGEVSDATRHEVEFVIDYKDVQSATAAVLGSVATVSDVTPGSFGVVLPKGAFLERGELIVIKAFTSSGTIGSATLVMGLTKASDRTTALSSNGITTTSLVGSVLTPVGTTTPLAVAATGAGALFGTVISENGVICVANSTHASNPYTDGKLKVKLYYSLPQVTS